MYKYLFVFISLFPHILFCSAQNNTTCINIQDLLFCQRSSVNQIDNFLEKRDWSIENSGTNESKKYFNYSFDFSVKQWQNLSTAYFEGILSVYFNDHLPNIIIYKTTSSCFKELLEGNTYNSENENYKTLVKTRGNITIELREYKNTTDYDRFSILVYNDASLKDLIRVEDYKIALNKGDLLYQNSNYSEAIGRYELVLSMLAPNESLLIDEVKGKIENCRRKIIIDEAINEGDTLYLSNNYIFALDQFELARSRVLSSESELIALLDIKIRNCRNKISQIELNEKIDTVISSGNIFFEAHDFKNSAKSFETAYNLSLTLNPPNNTLSSEIESKLKRSKDQIELIMIYELLNLGNQNFEKAKELESNQSYVESIEELNSALSNFYDAKGIYELNTAISDNDLHLSINEGIKKCNFEIEKIDNIQKVFRYNELNSYEFNTLKNKNYSFLNSISTSSIRNGNLEYEIILDFDYLGTNNSVIKIKHINPISLNSNVSNIFDFSTLPSTKINNYFVPSHDVLTFDLVWSTKKYTAKTKKSRSKINPALNTYSKYQMEEFINNQKFKRGTYKFEITNKELNGSNKTDVSLIKYRNNAGPSKMFYSVFWPGWGTTKVTDGKKGGGRALFFLFTGGISIASKIYSDQQLDKYINAYGRSNSNDYYEKADIANKIFIVSGAIAATIYVNDILWVFGKGIKNNKETRPLKRKLKNGSITISNSTFNAN